jgi:hypothetical protein
MIHAQAAVLLALLALPTATPPSTAAPAAAPALAAQDFVVAGIHDGSSLAEVRKALGEPSKDETGENLAAPDFPIHSWLYPGLTVTWVMDDGITGVALTDATRATSRGLKVGDSTKRAVELYGPTGDSLDGIWDWYDTSDESNLHVLRLETKGDEITSIYLGYLID